MRYPRSNVILALTATLAVAGPTGCRSRSGVPLHPARMTVQPFEAQTFNPLIQFTESSPLQIAVFVTKPEVSALGLAHVLREMGLPFFFTRSLDQALTHALVLIYPEIDGDSLTLAQADRLRRHVEEGGTIFAQNVFWGPLKPIFGFYQFDPTRRRHWLTFHAGADPVLQYLDRPEEQKIRLGSEQLHEIIWTAGYSAMPSADVLGRFEDGSAAFIRNAIGKGKTYLSAVALDDVTIRDEANRDYEAQRSYVNEFEPGGDVWKLILRAWYETYNPNWVRLATIPNGGRSVVLLSHDLDDEDALPLAGEYLSMERRYGAASTLFVQTKYLEDSMGPPLLNVKNLKFLRHAKWSGVDLGSHSISHALTFHQFPTGTGQEDLTTYRPRIAWMGHDYSGATVFGEVKISKELLDGELPEQHTIFFRAGHLRVPPALPEALQRCGYEFDSSFTAGDVLTNFPYALPKGLSLTEDTSLYEFPVTMEDEEAPGLAGHVEKDLDVIEANARNGAINVLLVHPNDPEHKVPAEEALLKRLPAGVRASDLITFARYWRARDQAVWEAQPESQAGKWTLKLRVAEPAEGLTFEFQRALAGADGLPGLRVEAHRLILPALNPGQEVTLHLQYSQ